MIEQTDKDPVLIIQCPGGSNIKLYQELSESFIKELIDEFTQRDGVTIIKPTEEAKGYSKH